MKTWLKWVLIVGSVVLLITLALAILFSVKNKTETTNRTNTVYTEATPDNFDNLILYDGTSGKKRILNSVPAHIPSVAVDWKNNLVVWCDDRKSKDYKNYAIYIKNLTDDKEAEVIGTGANVLSILGDKIAFKDISSSIDSHLLSYFYDLSTKQLVLIDSSSYSYCINIYEENKLMYTGYDNLTHTETIVFYDLSKEKITRTLENVYNPYDDRTPCPIYNKGNLILVNGTSDEKTIYSYNLENSETRIIANIVGPDLILGGRIYDVNLFYLTLVGGDEIRFLRNSHGWVAPDVSKTYNHCFSINMTSEEQKNIDCEKWLGINEFLYIPFS